MIVFDEAMKTRPRRRKHAGRAADGGEGDAEAALAAAPHGSIRSIARPAITTIAIELHARHAVLGGWRIATFTTLRRRSRRQHGRWRRYSIWKRRGSHLLPLCGRRLRRQDLVASPRAGCCGCQDRKTAGADCAFARRRVSAPSAGARPPSSASPSARDAMAASQSLIHTGDGGHDCAQRLSGTVHISGAAPLRDGRFQASCSRWRTWTCWPTRSCARRANRSERLRWKAPSTNWPRRLGMDPIELRVRNEPEKDPTSGKPFSSRNMVEAYRDGAERFGWSSDTQRPARSAKANGWSAWAVRPRPIPTTACPAARRASRISRDG